MSQLSQVARPGVAVAVATCGATKADLRGRENTGQRGRCHVDFDWLTQHEANGGRRGRGERRHF